ncbi:DUF4372 domain-containing protein [Sphingobacterium mizutaii]|uniref:DUF4372 domain-containing protein n=1 Tax=Sphingobacterium mizutaii TaxID=1010 RepID=UPI001623C0D4
MVNINVFSQILGLIDRDIFGRLVQQYQSDKHHKGINSWTHCNPPENSDCLKRENS